LKLAREDLSSLRRDRDEEQTQPGQFVPARPGARRDALSASPGAYSQVDASRRSTRSRSTPPPRTSVSPSSAPFDEEADTARRPSVAPGPALPESAAGSEVASPDLGRRLPPASSFPPARSSVPPLARALEQRPQVITEHPPIFVQRRDSSPTRLEIPAGPIGAPHRTFTPEALPTRPRLVVPEVEEATPQPRRVATLPDSLTPPRSAAVSAAPESGVPRSSTLWLVSGVIAAVLVLGLGMGLKHWRGQGVTHTARPAPARHEPARAAVSDVPAPAPPPSELTQPKQEPADKGVAAAPEAATAPGAAPKPARAKPALKPTAPPASDLQSAESAPKRPAPRKISALPDNPY
jgi:hypothetical protein